MSGYACRRVTSLVAGSSRLLGFSRGQLTTNKSTVVTRSFSSVPPQDATSTEAVAKPPPATTAAVPSTNGIDTSKLLDAFRDPLSRDERANNPVGKSWHAKHLRRKSFQDLHALWWVLYKEKNMLLTELALCRRNDLPMVQPERMRKVRKSMGAIKQVLGERKRDKIAAHALKQMELAEQLEAQMQEEGDEEDDYEMEDKQDNKH